MGEFLRTATALALLATVGMAQAGPVFQGRLANGTHSGTCTVSGANKCAMFYNTTLDFTILNDWNIGKGFWFDNPIPTSAHFLARTEGAAQTDFTGWVLPQLNQFQSLWNDVGRTTAGLMGQFDGVKLDDAYWSGSGSYPYFGSFFNSDGTYGMNNREVAHYVVAVRPGDVAPSASEPAPVPEPATLALVGSALLGIATTRRRKPAVAMA